MTAVHAEAAQLIREYPRLDDAQLARLVDVFRTLSALDLAFMLSDDEIAPQLEAFRRDHGPKIRPPFRQYRALLAIAVAGLLAIIWMVAAPG